MEYSSKITYTSVTDSLTTIGTTVTFTDENREKTKQHIVLHDDIDVRKDKQGEVQPAVISHGNNTPRPGYGSFQDRFDWAGTFDPTGWFCAGEAIRWLGQLLPGGWGELRESNHQMAIRARRVLSEALEVESPCPENMLGAMATLPLPERFQAALKTGRIDAEQERLYDRFRIEVPLFRIGQPQRRYFRISAHIYNSLAEYEYLTEALSML